jgi:hypothetical protein
MRLGKLQEDFSMAYAQLVLYAARHGLGVREKSGVRCDDCPIGKEDSVHKLGLAKDIRLTISSRLIETIDPHWEAHYHMLHDYWDELGGAPRIEGDLGHFSFKYQGRW